MPNSDVWTDKQLAELERRIRKVYEDASRDVQKTIDNYYANFAKRDAHQLSLLDAGKITEDQYKQWRLNQMARGERYEALRDRLAERMTTANETAIAYVNQTTPSVYCYNRNYSAYTIESVSGHSDFALWDEATVKRLIKDNPEMMPYYPPQRALKRGIDLDYGKQQIGKIVTSGILQGQSIPTMAKNLRTNLVNMDYVSSVRTARTAITGAQNAGRMDSYYEAERLGIKMKKVWLATLDSRTRHSHQMLDGEMQDNKDPFSNGCMFPGDPNGEPGEIYNCRCTLVAELDDSPSTGKRVSKNPKTNKYEESDFVTYKEWSSEKTAKTVAKNTESDIIRNEIGFQFFANRGISKQSDKQLQKSIASWERQIAEHEDKIANPRDHDSNWDNMNEIQRQGEINHWKKEIKSHRKNIEEAQAELRRRKND